MSCESDIERVLAHISTPVAGHRKAKKTFLCIGRLITLHDSTLTTGEKYTYRFATNPNPYIEIDAIYSLKKIGLLAGLLLCPTKYRARYDYHSQSAEFNQHGDRNNQMNMVTNKQKNNTKEASQTAIQGAIFPEGRNFK